jgi:two-component system response regulator FlrC
MRNKDILIVEDNSELREALSDTLELSGYTVASAASGKEALGKLIRQSFRLIISDIQMAPIDGIQLLETVKQNYPELPVLLMTAYGTIEKAVEAMRLGAVNFMVKPFEADQLATQVAQHIAPAVVSDDDVLTRDPKMKALMKLADRVAASEASVMIHGESGTGKEVLSRYIHTHSARKDNAFVAINCAAIPENMLEAVLFGYDKGAFTGAHQAMPGKFEQAQGGTLLLDEVSEMDVALQAKLLRVLQEEEVERLGSRKVIKLDVRILATTNQNLREAVSEGRFREDLFYRLNVFPLRVPTLRERKEDITVLANRLIAKHWKYGKPLPQLLAAAEQKLQSHNWPGNVRELENVVQRALILLMDGKICANDIIYTDDFEAAAVEWEQPEVCFTKPAVAEGLGEGLRSVEEKIIIDTLKEENGSRKVTADRLGISPRTLRYKIARMRDAGIALPC